MHASQACTSDAGDDEGRHVDEAIVEMIAHALLGSVTSRTSCAGAQTLTTDIAIGCVCVCTRNSAMKNVHGRFGDGGGGDNA